MNGIWAHPDEQAAAWTELNERIRAARARLFREPKLFTDKGHPHNPALTLRNFVFGRLNGDGGHIGRVKAVVAIEAAA